jgi:hypothetical protein
MAEPEPQPRRSFIEGFMERTALPLLRFRLDGTFTIAQFTDLLCLKRAR